MHLVISITPVCLVMIYSAFSVNFIYLGIANQMGNVFVCSFPSLGNIPSTNNTGSKYVATW